MSQILKQSTQVIVRIGPFMDSADAVTPETGITLAAADQAEALKAAGAATVDISGNTWAAVTGCGGWYDLTLSTTDTNTIGTLDIVIQDTSVCLPVFARFQVIEEAVYDALYASSAPGYLQPTTAGRTLDVSAGGEAGIDWANVGSPTTAVNLSGTNIKTDQVVASVSGAVGSVTGAVGSVTGAVGSVTGNVGGNVVGSVGSVTGAVASVTGAVGSVTGLTASDVGAIKAKTDSLNFTVSGQVDSNVQYVNDVQVIGTGATGDEWGPV